MEVIEGRDVLGKGAATYLGSSIQDVLQREETFALRELWKRRVCIGIRFLLTGRREQLEANGEWQRRAPTTQEWGHIMAWLQSVYW